MFSNSKGTKIPFLEVLLELACYSNQKSIAILGTFSMAKIAKRHATPNGLLNQMPPIDRLVNYAWCPGTVQLHKPSCASDAFLDMTFHLYERRCVCVFRGPADHRSHIYTHAHTPRHAYITQWSFKTVWS